MQHTIKCQINFHAIKCSSNKENRESAGQQDTNAKTNVNAQQSKQKAIKSMPKGSRKHTHTHTWSDAIPSAWNVQLKDLEETRA